MAEARNLLDMVPERAREWRAEPDGRVAVLEPRFGRTRLGRWLGSRSSRPHIEVRLDTFGTAVWTRCDGRTPVRDIARVLREAFGDAVEPVEDRLAEFLRSLERTGFVTWR